MTDDKLENYPDDEDMQDDLFVHFEQFGRWDWCDIGKEGLRVFNLVSGMEAEEDSPIENVLYAIAAQSKRGAMQAVAAALGVDYQALYITVSDWYEKQDNLPPPVTPQQFIEMVEKTRIEFGGLT